ncbi:hypothetical protein NDU88_005472 [Pleurodeles waltl]|uniref:Uncharacterized protein n=1 Tax=Pleurodeles waltl TaxID=8319 RepID=A0AAV7RJ70_PLEWA|nr:hypothetical protein NDU88_005472 [Pleurodeles waltl]
MLPVLRALASMCDYKDFQDKMLRDQLVLKVIDKKIQEKLLNTEDLTLQKAIDIIKRVEITNEGLKESSSSGTVNSVSVDCSKFKKMDCSRVSKIPATYRAEVGNPDIQVPENTDREDGQSTRRAQEEDAIAAGNPDIQVPANLKRENVLRVRSAEEGENAERRETQRAEDGENGENATARESDVEKEDPVNRGPLTSQDNTTEGQEGPRNKNTAMSLKGHGYSRYGPA